MPKSASLRLLLSARNATGEEPVVEFDEALLLSGFTDATPGRRIRLAAAAVDTAVTFTDAIGLFLFSHDNPFSLRLVAGQALLANLRAFLVWADDEDDDAHSTSVLLTGNTLTPSDIEVWIIEKPA